MFLSSFFVVVLPSFPSGERGSSPVEHHHHHLIVAGATRAHTVVGREGRGSASEPYSSRVHAGQPPERLFTAPEATCTEHGDCKGG